MPRGRLSGPGDTLTIKIPALSPEARRSVWIGCLAITLASIAASEVVTFLISTIFTLHADVPAYLVSGVVPMLLAGPGSYFQLKRLEQIKDAYRELERVASTDWLTGCLNRRAFTAAASPATAIGRPSALLVIDVDGLKSINDSFGHDRGDEVVRTVASVIRARVDASDLVGRIDGEEFAVYLRVASERHAAEVAESIRTGVEAIVLQSADAEALSVSVGMATIDSPIPFADLFRIADRQLRTAKANGRNRIAITAAGDLGKAAA